jgi:hypothetical protein
MSDRLYHYTNVQSLAYILSSRRLRFTRLDRFDDVFESQKIGAYNFGEMLYASSWVATDVEDYPQWSMYGDSMRGVRVTLSKDPFDWHPYVPLSDDLAIDTVVPMPMSEALGPGFKVVPFLTPDDFCRRVEYVPDVERVWKERSWTDGLRMMADDPRYLASYKDERWAFQKEHRFVLQVQGRLAEAPKHPESYAGPFPLPQFSHIDLPISVSSFGKMAVTLGPLRSAADRLIVEAMLEKYCPSASLHESSFFGAIRARGG